MKVLLLVTLILSVLVQCCLGASDTVLETSTKTGNSRIVGGSRANSKYIKGTALIIYEDNDGNVVPTCTGTIVGRNYILSAASCFVNDEGEPWGDSFAKWQVIPSTKLSDGSDSRQAIDVRNIFVHKLFKGTDYRYNVAVLELNKNIPIRKFKVVSLANQPRDRTRVRAVGYGKIDDAKIESKKLRMVDMVYRKFGWCNRKQQRAVKVNLNSARNICAVSLDWPVGRTGVCDGDTGGPLFKITNGNKLEQIGITSFSSYGCAAYNAIPWFTRVKSFNNAINRIVKNNFDGSFSQFVGDRQGFTAAVTG